MIAMDSLSSTDDPEKFEALQLQQRQLVRLRGIDSFLTQFNEKLAAFELKLASKILCKIVRMISKLEDSVEVRKRQSMIRNGKIMLSEQEALKQWVCADPPPDGVYFQYLRATDDRLGTMKRNEVVVLVKLIITNSLNSGSFHKVTGVDEENWIAEMEQNGATLVLAFIGNAPVGCMVVQFTTSDRVHVHLICVLKRYRKHGIAEKLLNHVMMNGLPAGGTLCLVFPNLWVEGLSNEETSLLSSWKSKHGFLKQDTSSSDATGNGVVYAKRL